jgi:hypothetical protein
MGRNATMELSDFRVESLTDINGNKGPGEVADLASWVGLQCVSKHSVVRIKNLTTQAGKTLTDSMIALALDLFPAGYVPDAIFMSRRSRSQLRADRSLRQTNSNNTKDGNSIFANTPTDFEGIPIIATDSILDIEPIA